MIKNKIFEINLKTISYFIDGFENRCLFVKQMMMLFVMTMPYWMQTQQFQYPCNYELIIGNEEHRFYQRDDCTRIILGKENKKCSDDVYIQGDIHNIEFHPNVFSSIVVGTPLLDIPQKTKLVYNIERILKDKGELTLIDYDHDHEYMKELMTSPYQKSDDEYKKYLKTKFKLYDCGSINKYTIFLYNKRTV